MKQSDQVKSCSKILSNYGLHDDVSPPIFETSSGVIYL